MAGFFERVKQKVSGAGRSMKSAGSRAVSRTGSTITGLSRSFRRAGTKVITGMRSAGTRVSGMFRPSPIDIIKPARPVKSGPGLASQITKSIGGGIYKIKGVVTGRTQKSMTPTVTKPKTAKQLKEEIERKRLEVEMKKIERQDMVENLKTAGSAIKASLAPIGRGAIRVTDTATEGIAPITGVGEMPIIRGRGDVTMPEGVSATGLGATYDTGIGKGTGVRFDTGLFGGPATLGGEPAMGAGVVRISGLEEGSGMNVRGIKDTIAEMTSGTAGTGKLGAFKVMEEISVGTAGKGIKGTKVMMDELIGGSGSRVRSPFAGGEKSKISSPFIDTRVGKIGTPFIETKVGKVSTPFESMTVSKVSAPWFETTKGKAGGVNIASIEKMLGGGTKVKADFGISPATLATGGITPVKLPEKVTGVNLNRIMEGMGTSTKVGTSFGDITKAPVHVAGMGGALKLDTSMWGGKISTGGMGAMMGGRTAAVTMVEPTAVKSGVALEKVAEMVAVPKRVGMTGSLNIRGMEKMMLTPRQVGTSVDITRMEKFTMAGAPKVSLGAFDIKGAEKMIIKPVTTYKTPKVDVFAANGEIKRIRKSAARMLLVKDREEE